MSQWDRIKSLGVLNKVSAFYTHFPVDVRGVLAPWLEYHVFNSGLDADNPEHEGQLSGFMSQMLDQLGLYINGMCINDDPSMLFQRYLSAERQSIEQNYRNDPATMFQRIKNYLEQEQQLLNEIDCGLLLGEQQPIQNPPVNMFLDLKNRLNCLAINIEQIKHFPKLMTGVIEALRSNRINGNAIEKMINMADLDSNEAGFTTQLVEQMNHVRTIHGEKIQEFKRLTVQLLTGLNKMLDELNIVQELVLLDLTVWKIEQRKSLNGFPMQRNLDNIEELAKMIATAVLEIEKLLLETQQHLNNKDITTTHPQLPVEMSEHFQIRKNKISNLLQSLVTKMWIIERQPNQVLRSKITPVKPGAKLRLLVGEILNPEGTANVKVSLINEMEAKKLHENPAYVPESSIKLLNNKKTMRFNQGSKTFSVEFPEIKLTEKIPRRRRQSTQDTPQFVVEEKWCFFFSSEFSFLGREYPLRTISCPVSITVNPSQDVLAWAALIWDNGFADDLRTPFTVPKIVNCNELLNNLDKKFSSITGRGFTDRNRHEIRQKLLRNEQTDVVSWERFFMEPFQGIKNPKNGKPVSFWEWLFAIMKLCEKTNDPKKAQENQHFQQYWQKGNIVGFISRNEMEHILVQENGPGSFMFRFSDTILGSVTLVCCDYAGKIQKYQPYTLEELKLIPLANRVLDKMHLQYLYPANKISLSSNDENFHPGNILKTDAFSNTPENQSTRADLLKDYILRAVGEKEIQNNTLDFGMDMQVDLEEFGLDFFDQ